MILKKYRILYNSIIFLLIQFFVFNYLSNNCVHAADSSSTLSPQITIDQASFSWASRSLIIDSYIKESLLSEFEYRALKLDIIFNVRTNPAKIEQELKALLSKQDIINYFSGKTARYIRLKVRNIFNALLEEQGYDPFILSEYQDKIMEKLLEAHHKYLAQSGEYLLSDRIWKIVQRLTAEEILFFTSSPSSPEEHALKKKIKILIGSGLIEEGIIFDEKVWAVISEKIQTRRAAVLAHFNFYTQKYDKELKKRLMDEVSLRDMAYYFADTANFAYERQQARDRIYRLFRGMLSELDDIIEQNPYVIRLFLVNDGRHWQARYNALLDKIIREMLEIDVSSYELSVKKMLGQKIDKNSGKGLSRAIDIIVNAKKKMLTLKPTNYDLYHRLRAVNGTFENKFVHIDDVPVISESYGISGRRVFVSDNMYFINQGSSVFYQTIDPKTGENEVLIFTQQAPYVEVKKIKNDYSGIFKDYLKAFIAENFSSAQAGEFIAYVAGSPVDWDEGYEISKNLSEKCEKFFWQKFRLRLNEDA